MGVNLFSLLRSSSAVTAIIGTNPVRFYRHGRAPQGVVGPYVTQLGVSLVPFNTLSGLPLADSGRQQISCWSANDGTGATGIDTLARAVRDAIESRFDVIDERDMGQDTETGRYRIDFDVQVFNHRPDELPLSSS